MRDRELELERALVRLLAECRVRGSMSIQTCAGFEDAADLVDEDEIDEAVRSIREEAEGSTWIAPIEDDEIGFED